MNRRFYILTLLTALCCLLIFTLYPSFKATSIRTNKNERHQSSYFGLFQNSKRKTAFATIICDVNMIEATMVSLYSLSKSSIHSSYQSDMIVLIPESIHFDQTDIDKLENLGANIIKTSSLQLLDNNTCDNAIIHLWALFDYEMIVYFTPNVLFVDNNKNNVDQLFDYPARSALTSLTNENDYSLLILEPSPNSFQSLLREYRRKDISIYELLENSIDHKLQSNELSKNGLLVFNNGPMKPWNFHSYSDVEWKKYYDPVNFYQWRRMNNEIRHLFNPHSDWKNVARQTTVCDSYLESTSNITSFPIKNQFSVMISTYNPERIKHLSLIIRHLLKSKLVHTVFVTWHNPALEVPSTIFDQIKEQDYDRVKVLTQSFDSLNNRFNPTHELKTDAVYIMDDDIYVDLEDLEFTFNVWQSRKDSVVGHFPRVHSYDPDTHEATYKLTGKAPYSIILTKSMFIRSEYLFSFTCLLDPELHATVDGQLNCEDLGFSMMASGLSGAAPTYVRTQKTMEDFGLKKGISTNTAHMPARAQCISDFITDYWHTKDPLVMAYDAVSQYERPQIRVGNWNRIEKSIMSE